MKIGPCVLPKSLLLILAASGLLLIAWSFAVPILEAPDEQSHWQYARYLHEQHSLPMYGPNFVEANSPPLYYLLIAPFATATEFPPVLVWDDGLGQLVQPFPPRFFQNSIADFETYWPIRIARLITALISLLTIIFCFLTGLELTGNLSTGLLAAGIVAFLPQFTFRGMNVSNDALVTMTSALAIYLVVRLIRRGFTWTLGVGVAISVAGAILSKTTAIFLIVPLALAILSSSKHWRPRIYRMSILGITALVIAPWLVRNEILYGDPFVREAMFTAVSNIIHVKPLFSSYFVTTFPTLLFASSVGVFGWMNLFLPIWIYGFFGATFLVGIASFAWHWLRQRIDGLLVTLVSIPLINLATVVYINLTLSQPQGRFMFPSLSAIAVIVAMGLETLPRWNKQATYLAVGALAVLNVLILTIWVIPAYWPSPLGRISEDVAELHPTTMRSFLPSDDHLVSTGSDPQIVIETDLDTGRYDFLQFDIGGTAAAPFSATGIVHFAVNGKTSLEPAQSFVWQVDDIDRTITIPLFQQPSWYGHVNELRIDPIGDNSEKGITVRVGHVRLIGSLPRLTSY